MTFAEFKQSLAAATPPAELDHLQLALWHDARGDWEQAHQLAQAINSRNAARVHAYLHRKEGDLGNASYWYSRAGANMPQSSLQQEWEDIAMALLANSDEK